MSHDLNQCQFIGRLGKDPEKKAMPSGDAVTNISIAVGWKGKDKEGVEWVPVVFFGKLAEIAAQYLRKGSQVFISGRYRTQSWEKDGQTRYRTEIVADRMQMLGSKQAGGHGEAPATAPAAATADTHAGDFDDDIPF